jgi:hypothetical protein
MTDFNIGQSITDNFNIIDIVRANDRSHLIDIFKYLEETLGKRIMFLDGAMGTMVQRLKLQESDFRGLTENMVTLFVK